jgi:hypothetical protein
MGTVNKTHCLGVNLLRVRMSIVVAAASCVRLRSRRQIDRLGQLIGAFATTLMVGIPTVETLGFGIIDAAARVPRVSALPAPKAILRVGRDLRLARVLA